MPTPKKGRRLGGSSSHQRSMMANLAASLFDHLSTHRQGKEPRITAGGGKRDLETRQEGGQRDLESFVHQERGVVEGPPGQPLGNVEGVYLVGTPRQVLLRGRVRVCACRRFMSEFQFGIVFTTQLLLVRP